MNFTTKLNSHIIKCVVHYIQVSFPWFMTVTTLVFESAVALEQVSADIWVDKS